MQRKYQRYVVGKNDNIVSIAKRFGTTPAGIAFLNKDKGIVRSAVVGVGYDFRPGALQVRDTVVVPARQRPYGRQRRPQAAIMRQGQGRVRDGEYGLLGDEDCGDGQHLVDFGEYVACVSDLEGQPCGNGGTYDQYGDCIGSESSDGGAMEALQKILGTSGGASAYSAYQSGVSPDDYVNSMGSSGWNAGRTLCAVVALIGTVLLGPFGLFMAAMCAAGARTYDQPPENVPPEEKYPKDCGSGFYQNGPGEPCKFAGSGDSCNDIDPSTGGHIEGTYNDDGLCIPDADKTAANKPTWLCDQAGMPNGTVWFDQLNNVWFCLQPCDANETLDPSDGLCACNKGYARNASGVCVKGGSGTPGTGTDKTQPGKVKPKVEEKPPVKPDKPLAEKKESNAIYYAGAALLGGIALWLGLRKKK